jgi:hypothetical protein
LSEVGTSAERVGVFSTIFPLLESFFIILVDAVFTTFMALAFTNVFDVNAQRSARLACGARASPG